MLSRWILAGAVAVAGMSGCQSGSSESKPAATPASALYRADIARLCDVIHQSGADQRPDEERMYVTAQWLGDNLQTEEGRAFLVTFQQSADKAATLLAEAKRVGVDACPLASLWTKK